MHFNCSAIKWVKTPSTLLNIGSGAFLQCLSLEHAILSEGLKTIEEEAFAFCSRLTMMVIPSTVTEIQAHAFTGCTGVNDVYFLMTDAGQLEDFNWWDGVYPSQGEEEHGGMEFNTNRSTTVHVPAGTYDTYNESRKLEAWLFQEDTGCYPLWWIVNFGVVGQDYTVSDDLTGIYVDIESGLYAKDDNLWITPDLIFPGEIDYMRTTNLMDHKGKNYDQSNWVVLHGVDNPGNFVGHTIKGGTITGKLIDKRNPEIEVSSAPVKNDENVVYRPNVYIPCAFMGRTQQATESRLTFAFVQPKPQEYIKVDRAIFSSENGGEEFYIPAPDDVQGINSQHLRGGVKAFFDLYESSSRPTLQDRGYYSFEAINRIGNAPQRLISGRSKKEQSYFEPYVEGGASDKFIVYPLELPPTPIRTGIDDLCIGQNDTPNLNNWYSIDGRFLGTQRPIEPGFYINNKRKVITR